MPKVKISPDILLEGFNPISKQLQKIIIDVHDMEIETGDYSSNEALLHGIDEAKETLESEYEFSYEISENELNHRLKNLFYAAF